MHATLWLAYLNLEGFVPPLAPGPLGGRPRTLRALAGGRGRGRPWLPGPNVVVVVVVDSTSVVITRQCVQTRHQRCGLRT
jgi:hypothetical protein